MNTCRDLMIIPRPERSRTVVHDSTVFHSDQTPAYTEVKVLEVTNPTHREFMDKLIQEMFRTMGAPREYLTIPPRPLHLPTVRKR